MSVVRTRLVLYKKLSDNLVQEKIRLESCSMQQKEVENLALVGRMGKARKKNHVQVINI
jgi:hypothetical protein